MPTKKKEEDPLKLLKDMIRANAAFAEKYKPKHDPGPPLIAQTKWEEPTGYLTIEHEAETDALQERVERSQWAKTIGDAMANAMDTHLCIRWPRVFGQKLQETLDLQKDVEGFARCAQRWITRDGKSVIIVFKRPQRSLGVDLARERMFPLTGDDLDYHLSCMEAMLRALAHIHASGRSAAGNYNPGNSLILSPESEAFIYEATSFCFHSTQANMDRDVVKLFTWFTQGIDRVMYLYTDWMQLAKYTEPTYKFGDAWLTSKDPLDDLEAVLDMMDAKEPILAQEDISSGPGTHDQQVKYPGKSGWTKSNTGGYTKLISSNVQHAWFRFEAPPYHVPDLVAKGRAQMLARWWASLRDKYVDIHALGRYTGPLHENELWINMKGDLVLCPRPTKTTDDLAQLKRYQALDVLFAAYLFTQFLRGD